MSPWADATRELVRHLTGLNAVPVRRVHTTRRVHYSAGLDPDFAPAPLRLVCLSWKPASARVNDQPNVDTS
ncbi:MAG: hypothetical protein ACRDSL_16495 [Pseudonocardiaceae bacterium]